MGIIEDWGLSVEDLNHILAERPSARGILSGFIAEYKLQRTVFSDARIHKLQRHDDHDRSRLGDFSFQYQGELISVEVKSLQTKSVKRTNGGRTGKCNVDASDRRYVELPNGERIHTTCLLTDTFDMLAVNLFEFSHEWRFGFIRNSDLPRSKHRAYTDYQRKHLLATNVDVSWPLLEPFVADPFPLLDEIVRERRAGKR